MDTRTCEETYIWLNVAGSLLTKDFRQIEAKAFKPFMLKHFLYALIFIRIIIVNYIVNKRIILKKKMCMNESGSERAYDNIAAGAFENKFSMRHNNITIIF